MIVFYPGKFLTVLIFLFSSSAMAGVPDIPQEYGEIVDYAGGELPGAIEIDLSDRKLYLVMDSQTALAYPIAVGSSKTPSLPGRYTISDKRE